MNEVAILSSCHKFKFIEFSKLFSNILLHSGRTDIHGGHFDLLNRSGLGLYHYHHGQEPHLHPCKNVSTIPEKVPKNGVEASPFSST